MNLTIFGGMPLVLLLSITLLVREIQAAKIAAAAPHASAHPLAEKVFQYTRRNLTDSWMSVGRPSFLVAYEFHAPSSST